MAESKRAQTRKTNLERIIQASWSYIAANGIAALSLRAIARELDMTVPGMYRYYASRDVLLTALSLDALTEFTAALNEASQAVPENQPANRLHAILQSYFIWGISNPDKYQLLFTSPFAGYQIEQQVYQASAQVLACFSAVLKSAVETGKLALEAGKRASILDAIAKPKTAVLNEEQQTQLDHWSLILWSQIHGLTSLFLEGYLEHFYDGAFEDLIEQYIRKILISVGLN